MTSSQHVVSETNVLAVASHVTYGYVGNKMVTYVLQALGCDVSAIDTVHFSNHTAYKQVKGRKVPAEEIKELYEGLKQSDLVNFDMMITGYTASKEAVTTVATIGRDLKFRATTKPGSFFWVLDPVMGDEGRLYVAEEIVPAYKEMIKHADLIVPNCFEAELLSGVKITDMKSLVLAITRLHKLYQVPNVIVTSLRIDRATGQRRPSNQEGTIAVVGSTSRHDLSPRIFQVTVPSLPIFFSGTGDMFAALMVVRLREAVLEDPEVLKTASWRSPDGVTATQLPLAKATEKTLASMHAILMKTSRARDEEIQARQSSVIGNSDGEDKEKKLHLLQTRASEVRVVRYVEDLRKPTLEGLSVKFKAEAVNIEVHDEDEEVKKPFET